MLETSYVAKWLLTYQEGLNFMQLISYLLERRIEN
jgi:hypothetical protein